MIGDFEIIIRPIPASTFFKLYDGGKKIGDDMGWRGKVVEWIKEHLG